MKKIYLIIFILLFCTNAKAEKIIFDKCYVYTVTTTDFKNGDKNSYDSGHKDNKWKAQSYIDSMKPTVNYDPIINTQKEPFIPSKIKWVVDTKKSTITYVEILDTGEVNIKTEKFSENYDGIFLVRWIDNGSILATDKKLQVNLNNNKIFYRSSIMYNDQNIPDRVIEDTYTCKPRIEK
tara:strand:+ start:282 stop:818 length:537 start_codon:yes stop_codon:yes gene_type:complete